MATVLTHMAAYMSCGAARCRARTGMVRSKVGALYVRIGFDAYRTVPKTWLSSRSLVIPANNQRPEFVTTKPYFEYICLDLYVASYSHDKYPALSESFSRTFWLHKVLHSETPKSLSVEWWESTHRCCCAVLSLCCSWCTCLRLGLIVRT